MPRTTKKPKTTPTVEVRLVGDGVTLTSVSLRVVSEVLSAVQRLAIAADIDAPPTLTGDSLHLMSVKPGSAKYQCFTTSEDAISNLELVGRVVKRPADIGDEQVSFVLSPLEDLCAIAKTQKCSIELRDLSNRGRVLAVVQPDSYSSVAARLLTKGQTSVLGKIIRVGGATELRCAVRVAGRNRMLYCNVAKPKLASLLGERLFKRVQLHGNAEWVHRSWYVMRFEVHAFTDVAETPNYAKALASLRQLGGDSWDGIADPEAYVADGDA